MKKQIKILSNLNHKKLLFPDDYQMLCSIMFKAAKIANKTFSAFKWKRKCDRSLLTKADTEIELLFTKFCDHPDKGFFLIGEETIDTKGDEYILSALKSKTWIIDPIDGTAPFACNIPTWGISIAYAENGKIMEGAIFLPSIGEFYISLRGKNYYAENVNLTDSTLNFKALPSKNANFANGALISISQDIAKSGKFSLSNPVQAVCCTVFSATGLLRGRYAAYVGSMKLWDLAGALPMLINANFTIKTLNGDKISQKIDPKVCKIFSNNPLTKWRYDNNLIICRGTKIYNQIKENIFQF